MKKKPHQPVPIRMMFDYNTGDLVPLNPFSRIQTGYRMENAFPKREDKTCSCGCGEKLEGRQLKWRPGHSDRAFRVYAILAGNSEAIRSAVHDRDHGKCAECGVDANVRHVPNAERPHWHDLVGIGWEADHIVPVVEGGGACDIDGFRTLCLPCHKKATKALAGRRAARRKAGASQLAVSL